MTPIAVDARRIMRSIMTIRAIVMQAIVVIDAYVIDVCMCHRLV